MFPIFSLFFQRKKTPNHVKQTELTPQNNNLFDTPLSFSSTSSQRQGTSIHKELVHAQRRQKRNETMYYLAREQIAISLIGSTTSLAACASHNHYNLLTDQSFSPWENPPHKERYFSRVPRHQLLQARMHPAVQSILRVKRDWLVHQPPLEPLFILSRAPARVRIRLCCHTAAPHICSKRFFVPPFCLLPLHL